MLYLNGEMGFICGVRTVFKTVHICVYMHVHMHQMFMYLSEYY